VHWEAQGECISHPIHALLASLRPLRRRGRKRQRDKLMAHKELLACRLGF